MKYFLDQEFVEGFTQPYVGESRHFIDLISIGIVDELGRSYFRLCSEFNYETASLWVRENVLQPLYDKLVNGDMKETLFIHDFHKSLGVSRAIIRAELLDFFGCMPLEDDQWMAPEGIKIYGYYADYDWVLFCSLFGRMIDLPKNFPYYCRDLKQMMDDRGLTSEWKKENCPDPKGEHDAEVDAKWNKELYEKIITYGNQSH